MKTTNYEISKKLQEIGFIAETDFYCNEDEVFYCTIFLENPDIDIVPSYDLETIIDALPEEIEIDGEYFGLVLNIWEGIIYYEEIERPNLQHFDLHQDLNDESLADTAARLLIKLVEEGIINLKVEN